MNKYKKIIEEMKLIFEENKGRYGSPRITKELHKRGYKINIKTVAKLMKQEGLKVKGKRKYKNTTDSNHNKPIAANLLDRNFTRDKPNDVWVSDITYIHTMEGWLYLAVIIDLFSRKVIGYSIEDNMKTEMVLDALDMAYLDRKPKRDLMFHSDRGSQYASNDFKKQLKKYNMIQSMSEKGECWDNACSESFFRTLKVEEVYYKQIYATKEEARACIFEYVNVYYNKKRMHSTLHYLTPVQFEQEFYKQI